MKTITLLNFFTFLFCGILALLIFGSRFGFESWFYAVVAVVGILVLFALRILMRDLVSELGIEQKINSDPETGEPLRPPLLRKPIFLWILLGSELAMCVSIIVFPQDSWGLLGQSARLLIMLGVFQLVAGPQNRSMWRGGAIALMGVIVLVLG